LRKRKKIGVGWVQKKLTAIRNHYGDAPKQKRTAFSGTVGGSGEEGRNEWNGKGNRWERGRMPGPIRERVNRGE